MSKLRWGLSAFVLLLASPTLALADPVTAAVVGVLTSAGMSAAVATFVVNTAISVATPVSRARIFARGRKA